MAIITFLIGVLIHLVLTTAQTCDNIDDQVCQGFSAKTNVCTDPCLSKLCPRTCNLCPLKCYHCDGLSSPSLCTATQICPSKNYSCIVTESLGADFAITYRQGCATAEVCTRLFGSGTPTLIGRSTPNLNGECCDNDLCNINSPVVKRQVDLGLLPPRTTTPIFKIPTSAPPTFTTPTFTTPTFATFTTTPPMTPPPMMTTSPQPVLSSKCEDIDQASCQRLGTIKRDMCNDDCIVRACPRTCGKCAECYSCQHVSSPANCTNHLVCEPGEKCYVLKTLSFSGEEGYNLGCMLDNVCQKFNAQAGNVFGKRNDPVELSVDGDCCTGDLCNHVGLTHGSTVTTVSPPTGVGCTYTTAGHHCPTNFHLIDGKCMMLPNHQMPYKQAESYCRNHCSTLIENFSSSDTAAISYFIKSTLRGRSNYVYVGAQDANHNGYYTWNNAGTVVAHSASPVSGHYCLTYSATTKGVHPVTCSSYHYFLCQAQMK